jgi:hypothetical protein
MTEALLQAIEDRFNGDAELKLFGRKIYHGIEREQDQPQRPWVNVMVIAESPLDTFGSDLEELTLTFGAYTRKYEPKAAARLKQALMRVFDDCSLQAGEFSTVGFQRITASGPFMRDGAYESTLDYRATIQRVAMQPALRGV